MIRRLIKLLFNYYIVLKACWSIVMFQVLGFFALIYFDQGQDVIRSLSIIGEGAEVRHAYAGLVALVFWGWQSWRGSRTLLHLSYFNFWSYQPRYTFRAQVLIPRLLGIGPYVIFAWASYKAQGHVSNLVLLSASLGFWFILFLHFRKALTVRLRAWLPRLIHFVPDYIPIKNGAYPVTFIWKKQRNWLTIRTLVVIFIFVVVTLYPIHVGQYVGSLALVLIGFGTWLILASVMNFLELRLHFPVFLTLILMVIFFSYLNNNHKVATLDDPLPERPNMYKAFDEWIATKDSSKEIPVFLVAAEGGGIRAAYWTVSVLGYLEKEHPGFSDNIFAYSCVSGGSLGVMVHNTSLNVDRENTLELNRAILSRDFLAPVSSYLIYPDMLQKFIPIKIPMFDRARILERSWEHAWSDTYLGVEKDFFSRPFVTTQQNFKMPHVMLNGTHVETGFRTVVSDIDLSDRKDHNIVDLLDVMGSEVAVSTAVGLSARFPFITPPALIKDTSGKVWGNVVDGGYYENLGATTLVETYRDLREYAKSRQLNVRFHLVFIRNTKRLGDENAMSGLIELVSPFRTLANIWGNNGDDVIRGVTDYIQANRDRLVIVKLTREDKVNIPLGWYLSENSTKKIDQLLIQVQPMLKNEILLFAK